MRRLEHSQKGDTSTSPGEEESREGRDMLKIYLPRVYRTVSRLFCLSLFICSVLITDSRITEAQKNDPAYDQGEDKSDGAEAWVPAPPPPDDFDWIQLTSEEWLKGELITLYEEELEFDSDNLGLLIIEWEDVKQIRGHQLFDVRLEGWITVTGLLRVTKDKMYVITDAGREEFERNQLISIAAVKPKEIDYWSAKVSFGGNLSSGNSDQIQLNTKFNVRRRTPGSRLVLDYLGIFNTADGVNTVDNQRVNGTLDLLRTRRYYVRPVFGEYYRDPFLNIQNRGTLGTGIGYHIMDTSRINWEVTAGLAYQYTHFFSVEPDQDSNSTTPAFVAGTDYDIELTEKMDFVTRYFFNIVNKESGQYTHHVIGTLETEITDAIDFDISLVWDRVQKPTPRADGTIPKKDDFQLIFTVGVDF
jgi:putative salt-induced outer membrane protein YdiY